MLRQEHLLVDDLAEVVVGATIAGDSHHVMCSSGADTEGNKNFLGFMSPIRFSVF